MYVYTILKSSAWNYINIIFLSYFLKMNSAQVWNKFYMSNTKNTNDKH